MDRDVFGDIFCVDCNGYRKQKLIGKNSYDGTLLYICTECGCENSVQDDFTKDLKRNGMK